MAKYFTFEEMIKSVTAERKNINNYPTSTDVKNNILQLMDILDEIRGAWTIECEKHGYGNAAIIVGSGYRCEALNKAVGGSKTSNHMIGTAADIEPKNGRNKEFLEFLHLWLLNNGVEFDELINEKPVDGVPSWIHFSFKNSKGQKRNRVFTIY